MKKLFVNKSIVVLFGALGAWSVNADPVTTTESAAVTDQTNLIERFRYIETLDITAEKPVAPADRVEPVNMEVDDILAESQALED